MRYLILLFTFSAILITARGALYFYPPDPDHPGQCYAQPVGKLNYGDVKSLENCQRATCLNDGTIQIATCGVIYAPCGISPIDPSKVYPDCCPSPLSC